LVLQPEPDHLQPIVAIRDRFETAQWLNLFSRRCNHVNWPALPRLGSNVLDAERLLPATAAKFRPSPLQSALSTPSSRQFGTIGLVSGRGGWNAWHGGFTRFEDTAAGAIRRASTAAGPQSGSVPPARVPYWKDVQYSAILEKL
jgi:hypothetical protein